MGLNYFTIAPRTADEGQRLAAVRAYRTANRRPDPALDAIVSDAAHFFGVPIVLVSIVDEEQQCFQSCVGLDSDSTPRSISFCGHAIHSAEPFIVPDATQDERFAGNPLVIGAPHIRFYAGAPLISPEGHAIGTLCVIGIEPRVLSRVEITELVERAARVMARLEQVRSAAA